MISWHIYFKDGTWFMISYPSLYELFKDQNSPEMTNKIQILVESNDTQPLYIWEELAGIGGRWIVKEKVNKEL